ncbi:MAG: PrsW family intramembrane metalloprotease [Deltaproteobacteria bacterium]|nr:PrsW family intramembrane metalloprotease [Deltaproteobacteria bacterium]
MRMATLVMAPALAMVWFFYIQKAVAPQSRRWIAALFVGGILSAGAAFVLNHSIEKYTELHPGAEAFHLRFMFWAVVVGVNEELAKMLVLLALLYPRKNVNHPYQGLLAAATVALGFAAVENMLYLERFGTFTLLVRSVLTVPAHAFFTIPMGVLMVFARREEDPARKYLWLLAALGSSAALHGMYDAWLSLGEGWVSNLAYVQVGLMALMVWKLMGVRFAEQGNSASPAQPV